MNTKLIGRVSAEKLMMRAGEAEILLKLAVHLADNGPDGSLHARARVAIDGSVRAAASKKPSVEVVEAGEGKLAAAAVDPSLAVGVLDGYATALYQRAGQNGRIALVPVMGVLDMHEGDVRDSQGGSFGTSYDAIRAGVAAALADPAVEGIMLYVDSPGGAATGADETAAAIAAAGETKPVWAYSDGGMYSAALYLGSQAGRILIGSSTGVGSIGVIQLAVDTSKQLEEAGVKVTAIKSTPMKDIGASYRPMTEAEQAMLQEGVDRTAGQFYAAVAAGRGLTVDRVAELAGRPEYVGAEAVGNQIADDLALSIEEAIGKLDATLGVATASTTNTLAGNRSGGTMKKASSMATLGELKAAFAGDAEFVLHALETEMSMDAAKAAFTARQLEQANAANKLLADDLTKATAELAELHDKLTALSGELTEAKAALASPAQRRAALGVAGGSKPLELGGASAESKLSFAEHLEALRAKGMRTAQAVAEAKKADPAGWSQWQAGQPRG
jgi:signal peptide peptidase SppA